MRHGVVPQSGYGMTETCSHQYTHPDDPPQRIAETSGRACDGYEIRIWRQDDPDTEAAPGEIGEIGGRGASLMLGYFDDQQATEAAFNAEGWFMTGDLGWLDEAGYLHITGRKKDVIIRGGRNIYPARDRGAGAALRRHREGRRLRRRRSAARRAGVPGGGRGRRHAPSIPRRCCASSQPPGCRNTTCPEFILPLAEMPLTASGKIIKRELARWVAEGRVRPVPVR